MHRQSAGCALALLLTFTSSAAAQQRPLATEDPEPIGAGRILLEGGVQFSKEQEYKVSGLEGDLWRVPMLGISFGLSSIAELQIDGSLFDHLSIDRRYQAPLSGLLTITGDSTHDVGDIFLGTKIRFVSEREGRPGFALRFATKIPTASNESGLGLDTIDFSTSLLTGKTVRSIRLVGNVGFAILSDPTDGSRQNDVLTYGASVARALTQHSEIVGELYGRANTRAGGPFPGTESRSVLNFGGRYTSGPLRVDGSVFFGLTNADPAFGFTGGFTYVLNAFSVP